MIRKITLTVAAAALTMGGVVAFAGPAGAGAKVPLGDAHGTLHCSGITAKVKFNPPLSNSNTVPSLTTIKGKVSGPCTSTLNGAPGAAITKAKNTGSIQGNTPGTCSGLTPDGTAAVHLPTAWEASEQTRKGRGPQAPPRIRYRTLRQLMAIVPEWIVSFLMPLVLPLEPGLHFVRSGKSAWAWISTDWPE